MGSPPPTYLQAQMSKMKTKPEEKWNRGGHKCICVIIVENNSKGQNPKLQEPKIQHQAHQQSSFGKCRYN